MTPRRLACLFFAAGSTPLLAAGDPILELRIGRGADASRATQVEVVLIHPGEFDGDPAALRLAPAGGAPWTQRIVLGVTDAAGAACTWPWKTARPATPTLELAPARRGRAVYVLSAKDRAAIPSGEYRIVARLALSDGMAWRGEVVSAPQPLRIEGAPAPALAIVRDVLPGPELPQGWPLIVRLIATPAPGDRERTIAPDRLALTVRRAGAEVAWPWERYLATGESPTEPNDAAAIHVLDAAATAVLAPGDYTLTARLAGTAVERTLPLRIVLPPAAPPPELAEAREALRLHAALHRGDLLGARELATAAIRARPRDPAAAFNLAQVARASGQRAEGLAWYDYGMSLRQAPVPPARPDGEKAPAEQPPFELLALRQQLHALPAPNPPSVSARPSATAPGAPAAPLPAPVVPPPMPSGLQWATVARASSEYRGTDYGANRATGAPDVPRAGDHRNAWAPKTDDAGPEWLELGFATPVRATGVRIVQSLNPGTVVKIEALDSAGAALALWNGPDTTAYPHNQIGVLAVVFPRTEKQIARIRLTLDTARVRGPNAIDAVGLIGDP